jgi:hypothetical protein
MIITGMWIAESWREVPEFDSMLVVTVIVALASAYAAHSRHLWRLADEVLDGGDHLLVRYRNTTDQVKIANIANMEAHSEFNVTTIILHLVVPSRFGSTLYFLADSRGERRKLSPVVAELAARVQGRLGRVV